MPLPASLLDRSAERIRGVPPTFYQQHLVEAQCFADGAQAAEQRGVAGADRDAVLRHRDMVAASVLSAAAFLEVSVSALFFELEEGGLTGGKRHSRRLHARLSYERHAHEHAPMLQKYQLLLSLWDADPFHPSRAPCLQVSRLMRWCGLLVRRSAEPRWGIEYDSYVAADATVHVEATNSPHPHMGQLRLNSECAQWAVDSAINFSGEFCRRMSLPAREMMASGSDAPAGISGEAFAFDNRELRVRRRHPAPP